MYLWGKRMDLIATHEMENWKEKNREEISNWSEITLDMHEFLQSYFGNGTKKWEIHDACPSASMNAASSQSVNRGKQLWMKQ